MSERKIAQTSKGPMEYQITGAPPFVLHSHGTPSDCTPTYLQEWITQAGIGVISISRPGYGATPLSTGPLFADQADAISALLDELSIEQVAIYGVSGGGPTSIEFAARHPDRVAALMLECAISIKRVYPWYAAMLINSFFSFLTKIFVRLAPNVMVAEMVKGESTLNKADQTRITNSILSSPDKLKPLLKLILSQPPNSTLREGANNDMKAFGILERSPFEKVKCPTFIAHGTHDADVPFIHAQTAAKEIEGAQLFAVDKGFHLLALGDHADELRLAQIDFFKKYLRVS